MFGSVVLEIAIGIIFINILVSTICSTIREGIEALLKTRAAYLERSIRELLHDTEGTGIAKSLYNHPLVFSLFSENYVPGTSTGSPALFAKGRNLPSYIPSNNFAIALMDIAARGADTDAVSSDPASPVISLASIRKNILNIGNEYVQRALLTSIDTAQGDLNKAQKNIESWFNGSMDRVSGWYKRSTYWIIFWIGLLVSVGFNINTITIADYLYRNDAVRAAIVKRAEAISTDTSFTQINYEQTKKELETMNLPIGWTTGWGARNPGKSGITAWNDIFGPILGWLLTALAATLGAPFWFDLLNKVMVIRSTVKPHEKSPDEGSEDRQPAKKKIPEQEAVNIINPVKQIIVPVTANDTAPAVRDKDSAV
ncbi:MAG TPA: hypothetical protein VK645_16910, partial [Chitinophagaceae bacterium]|nr:hypothetical protein [Chitinophagaceae bacterium]